MLPEWFYSLPVVILSLALLGIYGFHRTFSHPAAVLTGLYLLSSVGAMFVNPDTMPGFNFAHSWQMLAGYSILIGLSIFPAIFIQRGPPPNLSEHPSFRLVLLLLCALAWFSLIYQIPFAIISFKTGADTIRHQLNTEEFSPLPQNLLTTLATAVSQFYPIYSLAAVEGYIRKRSLVYISSCIAGSLCVVVNSICFTARDGVLWFLMSFWLALWIYRNEMPKTYSGMVKSLAVLSIACGIGLLSIFTYQRFAGSSVGIFDSLVTYIGQQPYVFAETVAEQSAFYGLNLRLPLIAEMLGSFEPIKRERVYEWTFGTFAKDFYSIAGWPTAFAITATFSLFFTFVFCSRRKLNSFSYSLLLILFFQFMTQGVFYFRLGIRAGNYYIIIVLMLAAVVQLLYGSATNPIPSRQKLSAKSRTNY